MNKYSTNKFCTFLGFNEKNKTTVRTEIIAGIVTFLAMAYILVLNPQLILDDVNNESPLRSSVFIATALGGFVGTLLMALYAKLPLAQAPGLGLNSMVGGLLSGSLIGMSLSFGNSMLLVLISGVFFLLLSVIKIRGTSIREIVYKAIPESIRKAISVGLGLFIALIGLVNAGVIIPGQKVVEGVVLEGETKGIDLLIPNTQTILSLARFSSWNMSVIGPALVCIFGFIVIAVLSHFKVKGAVLIGIIAATLFGAIPGINVTSWSNETWAFWEHFKSYFSLSEAEGGTFLVAFTEGFSFPKGVSVISLIMVVITFCMMDMFDTMGSCVGCCSAAGLMDEKGLPLNYDRIMMSDSIATCTGALFGTSTVTTFVESGAGVSAGGRTGLTSLVTSILFLLSIFLLPLFASIPLSAAAPALIWVGCLMLRGVKDIKVDNVRDFVPAFLTIAMIPFCYSITAGIGLGILSYSIITIVDYIVDIIAYSIKKKKDSSVKKPVWDLHVVTIIITILFIIYFFVPTQF